jgi:hypothetical protein
MITISAFKWVPVFAQGQVRDLRARWALEEAGLSYRARLLEQGDQNKPEYRALQPFGQVPISFTLRRGGRNCGGPVPWSSCRGVCRACPNRWVTSRISMAIALRPGTL